MAHKRTLAFLVSCIALLSGMATLAGIFSTGGTGRYNYQSIRGENIIIYGEGLYKHMSAEVAIQGIAQDYITLFAGIPLLLLSLYFSLKGSLKWRFILLGTLGYFLVTYLFYLVMAMYNAFFLVYAALLGLSCFSLFITALSFDIEKLPALFIERTPVKFAGGFLIFNAIIIALLWLNIVLPPLLNGSIYPKSVEHYTTLIVQGIDLGLLLPLCFVSGIMLWKKKPLGYLLATAYLVFLSFLMAALVAKIVFMGLEGYNIIPVIFIIPVFDILSILCAYLLLKNLQQPETETILH